MRKGVLSSIGRAVMIQHTLFSLPFAVGAILLDNRGFPSLETFGWIILALIGARNGANGLNRVIDRAIDAKNPRTKERELPAKKLSTRTLLLFSLFCLALFLFAVFQLNPLCLYLSPIALFMIVTYSYTKRITPFSHYYLGATVAIAPMGALIAINGDITIRYLIISAAVAVWVAGFDILYALLDIDFDRQEGLFSIPARYGKKASRVIAALSHGIAFLLLLVWGWTYKVSLWYYAGSVVIALLLIAEHYIAWIGEKRNIEIAAYHINEILALVFLLTVVLEVFV